MRDPKRYLLVLPVFTGVFLMFWQLKMEPLWGDEYFTWAVVFDGGFPSRIFTDIHPPLYYVFLLPLSSIFSDGLLAIRLFSVVSAILIILLGWILCRRYQGSLAGDYFLIFMPLSCHLLLFSRMGRYYAFLCLLVLLSQFALDRLLNRRGWGNVAMYAIILAIACYTNLVALLLIPVHILITLIRRKPVSDILAGMSLALATLLGWVPMVFHQLGAKETLSPFANDVSLTPQGFLARILWPIYDFSFGENIPPWDWYLAIPGMVLISISFLWFLVKGNRRLELISFLLVVLSAMAILTGMIIPVGIEFLPSRIMFLLPFWIMVIAAGIAHMPRTFKIITVALLLFVSLTGTCRYFRDVGTFHSTYIIPWMEISHIADKTAGTSGLIFSDDETIKYYLRDDPRLKFLATTEMPEKYLNSGKTVVLIGNPRDLTPGGMMLPFTELLRSKGYTELKSWDFVIEDEKSLAMKQKLLGRDVSRVKKFVRLYVPEPMRRSGRFEHTTYIEDMPSAYGHVSIHSSAGMQGD